MFPDRLTMMNPGGLFGPVSVDRLGEEGIAATRNQTLMKLLEDTTTPDEGRLVCENRGSGIGAMLAALHRAGLPAPRFVDRVATFAVTFVAQAAGQDAGQLRFPLQFGVEPGGESKEPRARLRGDRREEMLDLLRKRGELSRSQIADELGLTDDATKKWLRVLRDEGLVELTTSSARSRHARYRTHLGAGGEPGDHGN